MAPGTFVKQIQLSMGISRTKFSLSNKFFSTLRVMEIKQSKPHISFLLRGDPFFS